MKKNNKFTFIELLIVFIIVLILVALLLPALRMVKQKSVRLACLSNLRQCFSANLVYAKDNTMEMPKSGADNMKFDAYRNGSMNNNDLRKLIGSYIKNDYSIWACPNVDQPQRMDHQRNTRYELRCNYYYLPGKSRSSISIKVTRNVSRQLSSDPIMSDQLYNWNFKGFRATHMKGGKYFKPYGNNPSLRMYKEGDPHGANAVHADGRGAWFDFDKISFVGVDGSKGRHYVPLVE